MTKLVNNCVVSKRVKTFYRKSVPSSRHTKRYKLHLLTDRSTLLCTTKRLSVPAVFRKRCHSIEFMNRQLAIGENCSTNYVSMGILSPATTSTSSCSNEEDPPHLQSSASSSVDHFEQHVLEPISHTVNGIQMTKRPCLTWACKACKKKTVTVDRRKAATLRERRRLRKVSMNHLLVLLGIYLCCCSESSLFLNIVHNFNWAKLTIRPMHFFQMNNC